MEKLKLNNEIVSMRRSVKRAQVHVVHKLTREINKLKNRKGSEKQVEKCKRKADRLKEELNSMKKIKLDDVSKFSIKNRRTLEEILTDPQSPCLERALGRLACHPDVLSHVKKLRSDPVDWVSLLDDLGSRTREKKKKKLKQSKAIETFEPGRFVRIRQSSSNEDLSNDLLINKESCSESDGDTKYSEQNAKDHSETKGSVMSVKKTVNTKRRNERQFTTLQPSEENIENIFFLSKENISDPSDEDSEHSSAGEFVENLSSTGNINSFKPDPFFLTDEGEYLSSIVKDDIPDGDITTVQKTVISNEHYSKANQRMKRNLKARSSFKKQTHGPEHHRHKFNLINHNETSKKINDKKALRRDNVSGKPITKFKGTVNEPPVSLHPSWEAKKKLQQQQLNIHAFQGKKITFDDND